MIPFNKSIYLETSVQYMREALKNRQVSGDYKFTKQCCKWMEDRLKAKHIMLTTSGSTALDMAALLLNIEPGDEVIMPSYTFVTTANAFVLRGATVVFVDIRPETMNIDERLIEAAITQRTKAIVVVHYAGVACGMDSIMEIAHRYGISVVEDAAQGVLAFYKGQALGTIGDLGCYSFHETKNYTMGEGGGLVINDERYFERAEVIREKGTDRSRFFRGEVDKYSWVDVGSSFLPSDINAALLYSQLEIADEINRKRTVIWRRYYAGLEELQEKGIVQLPVIPEQCEHNGHMFYLKAAGVEERTKLLTSLKQSGIYAVFHYVPLHSSKAGRQWGRFSGHDNFTTSESDRLLRLPLFYDLTEAQCDYIIEQVKRFYK